MFEKKSELRDQLRQARQELDACETRWRNIISRSPHGVLIVDAGGTIRFANPAATAIFGCRTEELLGEHFEIPAVSDKPVELSLKSRDGRTVAVEIWQMETEFKGEPAWFVALHDITERKRGEQEMRKLYRAITESPSIVMITDARGVIEYVNPKFTEVTGYNSAEAIGQNPRFLKSGNMPPATYEELWETISRGKEWRGEMVNKKKNGELYWEFAAISPIKDIEGAITHFVAVTEDITERKRVEEALRESEERFRATFDQAAVGIAHLDPVGRLLRINRKYCEIVGYTEEELKKLTFHEITHPDDLAASIEQFKLLRTGKIGNFSLEKRYIRKDGSPVWVNLTASMVYGPDGSPRYTVSVIENITARRVAEQAMRDSEEKFSRAFRAVPNLLIVATLPYEMYVEVNEAFERACGYRQEEVHGGRLEEFDIWSDPADRVRVIRDLQELGSLSDLEIKFKNKVGEVFTGLLSAELIELCGISCMVCIITDITERKKMEEALRDSETLFRIIFDQAFQLMGLMKPDGTLIKMNRTAADFIKAKEPEAFGKPFPFRALELFTPPAREDESEVLGKLFWETPWWGHSPELQERLRDAVKRGARGEVVRFEATHLTPEGRTVWVDFSLTPVKDEKGDVVLLVPEGRDITERKLAEEALSFSEARYRALFRDNPTMIVTLDADLTMLSVNPYCASQLGYTIDELEGRPVLELFYEDDRPAVAEQLRRCLQNPDQVYRWQFRKVRKDGGLLWVEELARAVNGLNGALNVLVVCQDITERKQVEEALRESEELFRATFNQAAVGIGHVDPAGRWLRVNQKYCDIVGYTEEELKALSVKEITHPHDLETSMKYFQLVLDGKLGNYSLEKRYIRKDGSPVWVNLTVSAVSDAGGYLKFVVGVAEDISDRKRAEEEIEKLNTDLAARAAELEYANLELEAFNYSVAHDLRKPLTVINGYCQTIMEMCGDKLDQQCTAYLRETYNGTLRMNRLIDALLDFSRLAHCEIKPGTVDLSAMAREISAELKMAEPERRGTFAIADGVTVNGDPALLRVVLENLLGNAWKYTGRQGAAVIEFGMTDIEGKPACFVRDNGPGFDTAYAEKLFLPFQRLPGADEYRGHGIGLATVERIIRRHNGRVWAEGEPGKGACFFFTLDHSRTEGA